MAQERPLALPQAAKIESKPLVQQKLAGQAKAKERQTKARKKGPKFGDLGALRNVKSF